MQCTPCHATCVLNKLLPLLCIHLSYKWISSQSDLPNVHKLITFQHSVIYKCNQVKTHFDRHAVKQKSLCNTLRCMLFLPWFSRSTQVTVHKCQVATTRLFADSQTSRGELLQFNECNVEASHAMSSPWSSP